MNTAVIDTNILISALIKDGTTRKILLNSRFNFIFPEYGLREIYFYKDYIVKKSGIYEKEFDRLLLRILKYVKLVPLDIIKKFRKLADNIMGQIDKKDTVFIATALAFACPIWSNDIHFKKQNKVKILTTKDIIKLIKWHIKSS
jgi:predicted nucleic acid-binding protein